VLRHFRAYRRQGDPGSTRYFLSLEDNLFRIFGGDRIKGMMNMLQVGHQPVHRVYCTCMSREPIACSRAACAHLKQACLKMLTTGGD
jgi:hypothetical protein